MITCFLARIVRDIPKSVLQGKERIRMGKTSRIEEVTAKTCAWTCSGIRLLHA